MAEHGSKVSNMDMSNYTIEKQLLEIKQLRKLLKDYNNEIPNSIELTSFQQRLYDKATKVANRKRGV